MQAINTVVLWIVGTFAFLGMVDRVVKEWRPM
jgi:hypothetical protein